MKIPKLFSSREEIPPIYARLVRKLRLPDLAPKEREDILRIKNELERLFNHF